MIAASLSAVVAVLIASIGHAVQPRARRSLEPFTSEDTARHQAPTRGTRILSQVAARWSAWRSSRRSPPAPRAVADWCDDLSRSLRSGTSLISSLVDVIPLDPATHDATAAIRLGLRRGRPVADALGTTPSGSAHLDLALTVLQTSAQLGGSAAPAIDRTAASLRQRAADLDDRAVQASQARLSAHVMTTVPILMLATLISTDEAVRSTVRTPLGASCIAAGLLLNATGWTWMRHIVGRP